jgi:hypothetical protein
MQNKSLTNQNNMSIVKVLISKGGICPRLGGFFVANYYPETPRFREGGGATFGA